MTKSALPGRSPLSWSLLTHVVHSLRRFAAFSLSRNTPGGIPVGPEADEDASSKDRLRGRQAAQEACVARPPTRALQGGLVETWRNFGPCFVPSVEPCWELALFALLASLGDSRRALFTRKELAALEFAALVRRYH